MASSSAPPQDYYATGSSELATESALLLTKLNQRLKLTKAEERLVIVLVGLPGRGKSFLARKLQTFLQWLGSECRVFNVGQYRRQAEEGRGASADFFDTANAGAAALRQEVARLALEDLLSWIDEGKGKGRVGIFDATNSTKERRDWVLRECTHETKRAGKPTGVVFLESVCDDADLLRDFLETKVSTSPDYEGVPLEEAMADIFKRCEKYEAAYETIDDDTKSYIKVFNLSSKLMVNHIYGMLAKSVVPALMAWNVGTRPVYLCRPAADTRGCAGLPSKVALPKGPRPRRNRQTLVMSKMSGLDDIGGMFSDALQEFMRKECLDFENRREKQKRAAPKRGLRRGTVSDPSLVKGLSRTGFPCHIATSTMPRACETVAWDNMPSTALSNLNPLDKGEFNGMTMEEIEQKDPAWYGQYVRDPFHTRFPGGECQADLLERLEPTVVCMEQQVEPVLLVTHTNVLQALAAYFRSSPAEISLDIDLPLNTVFKFTPAKGGGWRETRHCLLEEEAEACGILEGVEEE